MKDGFRMRTPVLFFLLVGFFVCNINAAPAAQEIKEAQKIDVNKYRVTLTGTGKEKGSPPRKKISVNNVDEFIKAIAPHTAVILKEGTYHLKDIREKNPLVKKYGDDSDGYELCVRDVKGLTITSEKKATLLSNKGTAIVMVFENCDGLRLENLVMGHSVPPQMGCEWNGDVLHLRNMSHVVIDGCTFFGSGFTGLVLDGVHGFNCINSTITKCTFALMFITKSRNILFETCELNRTKGNRLIGLAGSTGILFDSCRIRGNWSGCIDEESSGGNLFYLEGCRDIAVQDSMIRYNSVPSFANDIKQLRLIGNQCSVNEFTLSPGKAPAVNEALVNAVMNGDTGTAKGAVRKAKAGDLGRLLFAAVDRKKPELVKMLLQMEADPNRRYRYEMGDHGEIGPGTLLNYALSTWYDGGENSKEYNRDCLEVVRLLLDHGAIAGDGDCLGTTPLIIASAGGRIEAVKLLIKKGAGVNGTNKLTTPLHSAARRGYPGIVRLLIKNGAHVDGKNQECLTPLHMAAMIPYDMEAPTGQKSTEKLEIAGMLLDCGADLNSICEHLADDSEDLYRTPYELAVLNHYPELAKLFLRKGAKVKPKKNGE